MEQSLAGAFERAVDHIAEGGDFPGVEIVERGSHRAHGAQVLSLTIDREGGVDLATCERLSAALHSRLAEFSEPFTIEVESAGLNRRLSAPGDFERFRGRAVKVRTTLSIGGTKTHRGVLRGVRGSAVILDTDGNELPLPIAAIKAAHLEYDIRADLQRAKKAGKKYAGTSN